MSNKRSPLQFLVILLAAIVSFSSCTKDIVFFDESAINAKVTNAEINDWIYETMKYHYYWTDSMPLKTSTNLLLDPMDYFYSTLYQYGTTDRFSWIDSSATNLSNQLGGIHTSFGMRVNAFIYPNSDKEVALVVALVHKGGAAETAGIKRGDIILSVNEVGINVNNYTTILNTTTASFGMGIINNGSFVASGTPSINMTKTSFQMNPILLDTIINYGGKKVGYFVYNQFLTNYDDNLRTVFGKFKSENINELVIDLRYNGGGYISSSNLLTNLVINNALSKANVGDIMNKTVFNKNIMNALKTSGVEGDTITRFTNEVNNIGSQVSRVFVLTSGGTASASELVINNLKPFMEVVLVGENTYGKNVGSYTITDSKKRWNYGLQPITLMIFNANGASDYGTIDGFTVDHLQKDDILPYFELGDQRETLLATALTIMNGANAFKSNTLQSIQKPVFKKIQKLSLSDNPNLNNMDMWKDPVKSTNKQF